MKNRFDKYLMYIRESGKIVDINPSTLELENEAFLVFKSLYNTDYGIIEEDDNLIAIHTGGCYDNEELIHEFKDTWWWFKNHNITAKGGHYYFNTDYYANKTWSITGRLH